MRKKTVCLIIIIAVFLNCAFAEDTINTFMSGVSLSSTWFCVNHETVYWLHGDWEKPQNLYAMNLIDGQDSCLIEGDSDTWIWSVLDAEDSLLLSSTKSPGASESQILRVSYNGTELHTIAETGTIGVYAEGMLYYTDQTSIYEMDLSTEKSTVIYSSDHPVDGLNVKQYANGCLYFVESIDLPANEDLYELNISQGTTRKLISFCGDFFVDHHFLFLSDFDADSMYIMDLSTMELLDSKAGSICFSQGNEDMVLAYDINTYRDQNFMGGIYRIDYSSKEPVHIIKIGSYQVGSEFFIKGKLYRYNHTENIFIQRELSL